MSEINANIVVQPFNIDISLDQPGITINPDVTSLNIYAVGGTNGVPGGNVGDLQYYAANGFAGIPSNIANYTGNTLNLNVVDTKISGGTNGYVLQTDGAGNISWVAQTGGGGNGSPGGSNTQIQYNDAGLFGGSTGFTFNKVSNAVAVPGNLSAVGAFTAASANISGSVNASNITGTNIRSTATTVALGLDAGQTGQQAGAVGVGVNSGFFNQGSNTVALGYNAGRDTQGANSIAIGEGAGNSFQGGNSIAIGVNAGSNGQGTNSIAIGTNAAPNVQNNYTIVLNASGSNLVTAQANSFYVKPIRNASAGNILQYDATSGEVTYSAFSAASISNGTSNVNIPAANSNITMSVNGTSNVVVVSNNSVNVQGNIIAANITANTGIFTGNGSGLTALTGANVTGIVANANYAAFANTVGSANTAITVTGNAQPNITSVGTLTSLDVSGTANVANLRQYGSGNVILGTFAAANSTPNANIIALGYSAASVNQGANSIAIGILAGNSTSGLDSIAIGREAGSIGSEDFSIAIGYQAGANNNSPNAIAIGYQAGNVLQGYDAIAIGTNAASNRQGNTSIAIGKDTLIANTAANAVAIGTTAIANAINSTALGYQGLATGANAIGIGVGSNASGNSSIGILGTANSLLSIAIGQATAIGNSAIAIGSGARANADSVSIGSQAGLSNSQANTVAIGYRAGRENQNTLSVAIGTLAGSNNQGTLSIAMGDQAGYSAQGNNAIAIGERAGNSNQGISAVAIGTLAGLQNQGNYAIAIGGAGANNQGAYSIAIGHIAGGLTNAQATNSIVINATGTSLDGPTANALFVKPIRNASNANVLMYDATTGEITYGTNNANTAATVTTNAQPNITSVGTLTSLTANSTSNITLSTTASHIITASSQFNYMQVTNTSNTAGTTVQQQHVNTVIENGSYVGASDTGINMSIANTNSGNAFPTNLKGVWRFDTGGNLSHLIGGTGNVNIKGATVTGNIAANNISANRVTVSNPGFLTVSLWTAAALNAVTGTAGQIACVTDSAGGGNPNGMMAFWDTTNNRWSYIHDNSAV